MEALGDVVRRSRRSMLPRHLSLAVSRVPRLLLAAKQQQEQQQQEQAEQLASSPKDAAARPSAQQPGTSGRIGGGGGARKAVLPRVQRAQQASVVPAADSAGDDNDADAAGGGDGADGALDKQQQYAQELVTELCAKVAEQVPPLHATLRTFRTFLLRPLLNRDVLVAGFWGLIEKPVVLASPIALSDSPFCSGQQMC